MKIKLQTIWSQNTDLTFGEIRQVAEAAERAAEETAWKLRKAKIKRLGQNPVWCPIPRNCY